MREKEREAAKRETYLVSTAERLSKSADRHLRSPPPITTAAAKAREAYERERHASFHTAERLSGPPPPITTSNQYHFKIEREKPFDQNQKRERERLRGTERFANCHQRSTNVDVPTVDQRGRVRRWRDSSMIERGEREI